MFTRLLKKFDKSTILLGPRGTGKSTWIKQNFSDAVMYDLLDTQTALRLAKTPGLLYQETHHLPNQWIVIDEIQKVPTLLDEVHRLIEQHQKKFLLSGSSARKLKTSSTNLLAGRALIAHLFPLTTAEVNFAFDIQTVLRFGMLPMAFLSDNPITYLQSYAQTYLYEEIRAEALTRNVGQFNRFLEIAARQNAQLTNVSAIARDAMVSRPTVQVYFDILIDTLLGFWLPPWKLKQKTKQVSQAKFYFFDCGVARVLSGRIPYPPTAEELGHLFETFIINEIKAYIDYQQLYYPMHFWQTYDGCEVDLFCETSQGYVAIEMKSKSQWLRKDLRGLKRLQKEIPEQKIHCFGVYLGEKILRMDDITIFPVKDFLQRLWQNEIIK